MRSRLFVLYELILSACIFADSQQLLGPLDLFRRGRDSIGQRIRDAELLPLEEAQRVVGQYLHPLHRLEGRDELCGLPQAVFVVRQAGDEDMAYPERHAEVGDAARHRKDVRVVPAGEPAVLLRVDLLQIEDDEAGGLHQPVKIGQIRRIVGAEGLTGGVQSRMHALGACQLEERRQKLHLAQRLAAADRDAALFPPVVAVAPHPLEELVHRPFLAALSPGLRVVAVFAPQGAPLQKDDEADAGAVHRAESLQRVDVSDGVTELHGRYGR